MNTITKTEYLKYAIGKELPLELEWMMLMFSLPLNDNVDNTFFTLDKNNYMMKVNDELLQLVDANVTEAIFTSKYKITVDPSFLSNIKEAIESSVGNLLVNYVMLSYNLGSKVPYQTGVIDDKKIGNIYIAPNLIDDADAKSNPDGITIKEYINFVDACSYIQNWVPLFVVGATPKSMLPPPGIDAYRKQLIKDMREEHGEDVFKDYSKIFELETKLKEKDDEWIKDDPAYGKMLSGKITNMSRKKMFLTYGAEESFNEDGKADYVSNSLINGYPVDNAEELTAMFNTSRAGSFARGDETKNGGNDAKITLRATSGILVKNNDCGSRIGGVWFVTKDISSTLVGRTLITSKGDKLITDLEAAKAYEGKLVTVRSPRFCKQGDNHLCVVCAGNSFEGNETGVSLVVTEITSIILYSSMKKIHGVALSVKRIDMNEILT